MSSATRVTNRSSLNPALQRGRLAKRIFFAYLPICLAPMLLLGGLTVWVMQTLVARLAPNLPARCLPSLP